MNRRRTPAGLELAVLLTVADLGDDAYGLSIRREVSSREERDYSVGAIYTTLARLDEKGWVEAWMSDPLPVRGGRARRHFRVTTEGLRSLATARRESERRWAGQAATQTGGQLA